MKKIIFLQILIMTVAHVMAQVVPGVYEATKANNIFVYKGSEIKLFPGNKIFVEADMVNGGLSNFRVVKAIADSSITLEIEFTVEMLIDQKSTILKIRNPFYTKIGYKAQIKGEGRLGFTESTVKPLSPGKRSMEMWPYTVESVILSSFLLQ